MAIVVSAVLALLGCAGVAFILRNYRKQSEWQDGPGKVPEDYT